ncbi:MAR-binding filament-like protein 1 [Cardamine amara subsp. amara]|uniref:MAR-binding filament-like protein 1 n=1 Tax=Cardamine amara subsp. amara TaxID=228776 RepID=A0ABD1ADC0_CARAN
MGFLIGSSCFVPSLPLHSRVLPSPSPSQFGLMCSSNVAKFKRRQPTSASLHREDEYDAASVKRRAFLLVGISVLPFLQLRSPALADERDNEIKTSKLNQETEVAVVSEGTSPNPFLSLLNGLGIFSAGVLGALYALARQDTATAEETIESLKKQLKDRERALVLKEKDFEARLQHEQEQRKKELEKAKEEQMSLINQLNSAKDVVTGLGRELSSEKKLCEELKVQIGSLQTNLSKAGEDKKALETELREKLDLVERLQDRINLLSLELKDNEEKAQRVSALLAEKESELKNLNSTYTQTSRDLAEAKLEIKQLKEELTRSQRELDLKNSAIEELNTRTRTLVAEKESYIQKLDDVSKDYSALKLTSETRTAADAELISRKEQEIQQLKEKLDHALNDVNENKEKVADITEKYEDSKRMLDIELTNEKNLKHELEGTKKTLQAARDRVSNLEKMLDESRALCSEFESELAIVYAEAKKAKERYEKNLDEEKRNGEILASELAVEKDLLKKAIDELGGLNCELEESSVKNQSLQKELVEIYKKAETTNKELEEEKKTVLALNKEVKAMEKQILMDGKARKSLETDLEEAVKSLDEMNKNASTLSRELEKVNTHVSSLEDEKEVLQRSLVEARNAAKEAKENVEDAHILVLSLGKEREVLEKKVKKLEEDLGSAKGEILRMRSQPNSVKTVNSTDGKETSDNTVTAKKVVRRKKSSTTS